MLVFGKGEVVNVKVRKSVNYQNVKQNN